MSARLPPLPLSEMGPFGLALLAAAAVTLALAGLRHLREGRRRRDLQGDALALLGLPEDTRTPLVGPGLVLLVAGLVLVTGRCR